MERIRVQLVGLSLEELEAFVLGIGEKRFRANQLFDWIYKKGARSFAEMTNLSLQLRTVLADNAALESVELVTQQRSNKDASTKYLFRLHDGRTIESVLMLEGKRVTLCVSTQVGCAIDCKFCATGMMGLQRNLTAGEVVDQLLAVQALSGSKVTNLVCMGMGEPFHNYENLMKACDLLADKNGPGLPKRHIVVSTSGLIPKIYQFADEGQPYKLAISLNATTDHMRTQLMPLNKKWPIRDLLKAIRYYTDKLGQPVTFEYVLLDGLNDSEADAERLKKLLNGVRCKVNIIPYNQTLGIYRRPSEKRILSFYERLAGLRAPVTIRWSKGDDIAAGCGQLATENAMES